MWYLIQELGKACPPTVHCKHRGQNIGRSPIAHSSPELHCFCNEQPNSCCFLLFFNCAHCRLEQEHRLVGETRP